MLSLNYFHVPFDGVAVFMGSHLIFPALYSFGVVSFGMLSISGLQAYTYKCIIQTYGLHLASFGNSARVSDGCS